MLVGRVRVGVQRGMVREMDIDGNWWPNNEGTSLLCVIFITRKNDIARGCFRNNKFVLQYSRCMECV